jgi:hypothetical protein
VGEQFESLVLERVEIPDTDQRRGFGFGQADAAAAARLLQAAADLERLVEPPGLATCGTRIYSSSLPSASTPKT